MPRGRSPRIGDEVLADGLVAWPWEPRTGKATQDGPTLEWLSLTEHIPVEPVQRGVGFKSLFLFFPWKDDAEHDPEALSDQDKWSAIVLVLESKCPEGHGMSWVDTNRHPHRAR